MFKKLILLAMAVAALVVFVVPAAAQAEPIVTNAEGEDSAEITAVSTNLKITSGLGTIECGTVDLHLSGGTGHYEGTGTGVGAGTGQHFGPCQTSSGLVVHMDSITATLQLWGGGFGSMSATYIYRITTPFGTLPCDFNASAYSVTYTPTGSRFKVGGPLTGSGGAGCPSTGVTHGEFDLTSGGQPVSIH